MALKDGQISCKEDPQFPDYFRFYSAQAGRTTISAPTIDDLCRNLVRTGELPDPTQVPDEGRQLTDSEINQFYEPYVRCFITYASARNI